MTPVARSSSDAGSGVGAGGGAGDQVKPEVIVGGRGKVEGIDRQEPVAGGKLAGVPQGVPPVSGVVEDQRRAIQ